MVCDSLFSVVRKMKNRIPQLFFGVVLVSCSVFVGCLNRTNETVVVPTHQEQVDKDPQANFIKARQKKRDEYMKKKASQSQ